MDNIPSEPGAPELEAEIFDALRRMAVAAAELRAARSRFDTLIRLRDLVTSELGGGHQQMATWRGPADRVEAE